MLLLLLILLRLLLILFHVLDDLIECLIERLSGQECLHIAFKAVALGYICSLLHLRDQTVHTLIYWTGLRVNPTPQRQIAPLSKLALSRLHSLNDGVIGFLVGTRLIQQNWRCRLMLLLFVNIFFAEDIVTVLLLTFLDAREDVGGVMLLWWLLFSFITINLLIDVLLVLVGTEFVFGILRIIEEQKEIRHCLLLKLLHNLLVWLHQKLLFRFLVDAELSFGDSKRHV